MLPIAMPKFFARFCRFALASTMLVSHSVLGQSVTLTCVSGTQSGQVVFYESVGTAGFAMHGFDVPTSAAIISAREISWKYQAKNYILNRVTGSLYEDGHDPWNCSPAKQQF